MFTRWTEHLKTEEEKDLFRKKVFSAKEILDRLKTMLEDDLMMLDRTEENQSIYQVPNWDYLQAHKNGNRQVLNLIRKLVDLDQQKGTISDYKPTGTRPNS